MQDITLQVENVSLILKKQEILSGVDLTLHGGTIYGLVGHNGSGKTMLMKCICGFVQVSSGRILINGKQIHKDIDYLPNAGIIIENPGFLPYYTGYKNLSILASIRHTIDRKKIRLAMEEMGLDPALKLPVRKYSLGMRQRLGLAQAIMEDPDMLILDEPFNGLDQDGVDMLRKKLMSWRDAGRLILLASHSAEDIGLLCDEVYQVKEHRVQQQKGYSSAV